MLTSPPPTWKRPFGTLIVAATPRSGSNLLCKKLGSTGVLGNPREWFRHWDTPEVTTAERCLLALEKGATGNGVVAFKLFPEHFKRLQEDIRLSEWFPDPVWVHLVRRDLLGQAISLVKAMQDKAWISSTRAMKDAQYSRRGIEAALAKIVADNGRWAAYFARTGIEPLRLVYEDVGDDLDEVLQQIGARLGLDAPVPPTGDVAMKPQRNAQNEEWRRRFIAEAGDPGSFPVTIAPTPASGRNKPKWAFWRK